MLAVRRTDFNEKDHARTDGAASAKLNLFKLCRVATEEGKANLGEVRSLVTVLNYTSASKRNFLIDKHLTDVEVRLRRTFPLM